METAYFGAGFSQTGINLSEQQMELPSASSIRSLTRAAMKAQSSTNLGPVTAMLEQLKLAIDKGDSNPLNLDVVSMQSTQPQNIQKPELAKNCYCTNYFRMYRFKIEMCPNLGVLHDWTDCPFLHPGEKARRRDPRTTSYQPLPCPDFRKGQCKRGDSCQWAHGVFECWLHPTRYRTQLCKEGGACPRTVCFFAHSVSELREAEEPSSTTTTTTTATTTTTITDTTTISNQERSTLSLDDLTKQLASTTTSTTTQGQLPSVMPIQDPLYTCTSLNNQQKQKHQYTNYSSSSTSAASSCQSFSQGTSRTSSPLSQSYDNVAALNKNLMSRAKSAQLPHHHYHHNNISNTLLPQLSRISSHSLTTTTTPSSSLSSMHHTPHFKINDGDDWSTPPPPAAAIHGAIHASRLNSCPLPWGPSSAFMAPPSSSSMLEGSDGYHHRQYHEQQQMIDPALAAVLLSRGFQDGLY